MVKIGALSSEIERSPQIINHEQVPLLHSTIKATKRNHGHYKKKL